MMAHYGASFLILAVYGGQVCPFVESLSLSRWAASLAVVFAATLVARVWIVSRIVETAPYEVQSLRQAAVEFGAFAAGGLALAFYNHVAYGFPAVSGFNIFVGFVILSFFVATDLALERERRIAATVSREKRDLRLDRRFTPVTRKFTVVAIACAASVTIVLFLVFSRDLDWLAQLPSERIARARLVIMAEIGFVMATLLGLLLNLIVSFSRNLGLLLR